MRFRDFKKVIDYLNQIRIRTIEELTKAQNDYSLNSSHLRNHLTEKSSLDEIKSELFAEKFYFLKSEQINFSLIN